MKIQAFFRGNKLRVSLPLLQMKAIVHKMNLMSDRIDALEGKGSSKHKQHQHLKFSTIPNSSFGKLVLTMDEEVESVDENDSIIGQIQEYYNQTKDSNSTSGLINNNMSTVTESAMTSKFINDASNMKNENEDGDFDQYTLSGSMWDVSLLLGMLPNDTAGSTYCAFLLLINSAIQIIFTYILLFNLTEEEFSEDTILGFRSWRRNVAHSSYFMDDLTEISLAARVCSLHSGLESSATQAQSHADFQNYLDGNGVLMCGLTVFLWILTVMKEIIATVSFCEALLCLPKKNHSLLFNNNNKQQGNGVSIDGISNVRRISVLLVQFLRLCVVITLAYAGVTWLGNTVSVTDLVLNAVALEFVLCVDEIIFEALAPRRIRKLISSLEETPLSFPARKSWSGMDLKAILCCVAVGTFALSSLFFIILPFEHRLKLADDALCAGELNFVYAVNAGGVPSWAKSQPYEANIGSNPPTKSSGFGTWKVDHNLRQHEEEVMNFATRMIDNLIGGEASVDEFNCGEDIYYQSENQTVDVPYRATSGVTTLSFCESEYYSGMEDINGNILGEFTQSQRDCCLAKQIQTPNIFGGRLSIKGYESETVSTAMDVWNPGCVDMLGRYMFFCL
jgi:hypothetical protein